MLICPHCGSPLELTVVLASLSKESNKTESVKAQPVEAHRFTLSGRVFDLAHEEVLNARPKVKQPIVDSYVEIPDENGILKRYPTKDLLRQALLKRFPDLDPNRDLQPGTGFQTRRAEDIMRKLGFVPKRLRGA